MIKNIHVEGFPEGKYLTKIALDGVDNFVDWLGVVWKIPQLFLFLVDELKKIKFLLHYFYLFL